MPAPLPPDLVAGSVGRHSSPENHHEKSPQKIAAGTASARPAELPTQRMGAVQVQRQLQCSADQNTDAQHG